MVVSVLRCYAYEFSRLPLTVKCLCWFVLLKHDVITHHLYSKKLKFSKLRQLTLSFLTFSTNQFSRVRNAQNSKFARNACGHSVYSGMNCTFLLLTTTRPTWYPKRGKRMKCFLSQIRVNICVLITSDSHYTRYLNPRFFHIRIVISVLGGTFTF
jgi:hypothetical protein